MAKRAKPPGRGPLALVGSCLLTLFVGITTTFANVDGSLNFIERCKKLVWKRGKKPKVNRALEERFRAEYRSCERGTRSARCRRSLRYWRARAKQGSAEAYDKLAWFYFTGTLVAQDKRRADALYQKSCRAGWAMGCASQSSRYVHKKQHRAARSLRRKARKMLTRECQRKKIADSCWMLALYLKDGLGGYKNFDEYERLNAKACRLGRAQSCR